MDRKKFEKEPTSSYDWLLDEGRDTKAITLRLDKTWIDKLDKLARRISSYDRVPMTKQLLIQKAIWDAFISHSFSDLLKQFQIVSEREQVVVARQALKHALKQAV